MQTVMRSGPLRVRSKRIFYVNYDDDSRVYTWSYYDDERLFCMEIEADGTAPYLPPDIVEFYMGQLPHVAGLRTPAKLCTRICRKIWR
jgi:hypothetical protein